MPSPNIVKDYVPNSYYHLYNRGVEKRPIFLEDNDYLVFLGLLKRYLSNAVQRNRQRHSYDNLRKEIELLAYCLMPNHYHLLVYQHSPFGMTRLLRRVATSYSMYFNKKYKNRVGHLFQNNFKASLIDNEAYLWHISRYIHLNPLNIGEKLEAYPYSSYRYFMKNKSPEWLKPQRILELHSHNSTSYVEFVNDYIDYKKTLDEIKSDLADYA